MPRSVLAASPPLLLGAFNARDAAPAQQLFTQPGQPPAESAAPAVPPISNWEPAPESSSAGFVVKHVFSKGRGLFAQPEGTVDLDEAAPANSKIDATIQVNLISTGVEARDTHLKRADFFDAVKYAAITFVSTGVSRSGPESYSVTGHLTLHGVTRPVTLAVTVSPPFNHAGGIRRGIEATTSVNRKDFGLRWEFPGEGRSGRGGYRPDHHRRRTGAAARTNQGQVRGAKWEWGAGRLRDESRAPESPKRRVAPAGEPSSCGLGESAAGFTTTLTFRKDKFSQSPTPNPDSAPLRQFIKKGAVCTAPRDPLTGPG